MIVYKNEIDNEFVLLDECDGYPYPIPDYYANELLSQEGNELVYIRIGDK